jgi:Uma2 family endonuclease
MATVPSRRPEVIYPERDGKPMAETVTHQRVMIESIDVLWTWYADDPTVWVGGNQFLYYVEGDPRKSTSPDVYVALGIGKEPVRDIYLLWQERQPPDFILEVTSRSTRRQDVKDKFELYRDVLRVREYFLFDPLQDYLRPSLRGYRLVKREYVPVAEVDGRLPSAVLGLHLERDDWHLRFYNPATRAWLQTAEQVREALRQQEKERKKAEAARKRAEASRKRAEAARKAEAEARQQAEAEVERLQRELEALRRQRPGRS